MTSRTALLCLSCAAAASLAGCASPLIRAASDGQDQEVSALLSRGANIEDAPLNGCGTYPADGPLHSGKETPLICATINGHLETVRLLLDRGADVNAKDYVGRNALYYAQYQGREDIATLLRSRRGAAGASGAVSDAPSLKAMKMKRRLAPGSLLGAPAADADEAAPPAPVTAAPSPAPTAPPAASDVDRPSYSLPEDPDAYALVIGVEHYESLPPADYAERDAAAVRAHLLALGYPQRNIAYLTGTQGSFTNIKKYAESWLPNRVNERSTVFVYFSGHGAPDLKTSAAYLVPYSGDPEYLEDTAYPLKRLYEKLNALKAKRVIVALDSCFSGAGGRSVLAKGARPLVVKVDMGAVGGDRIVSLSASAGNEISGTLDEQSHGAFTYYLLKGLDGAAADDARRVTVKSLYDYLAPKVEDSARLHNRDQTPQLTAADPGGIRLR